MKKDALSKIIYFDKETIKNILQEKHKGTRTTESKISENTQVNAEISAEASGEANIGMPFTARLKFAFSGKIATKYLIQHDSATTITSTEISDFENIKSQFQKFDNVQVLDIENSSTFYRVAGGYLRMVGNNVEGVNVKEFKSAMESFEGYDVYKIDSSTYVRFNNVAFVSNYKRNDLLTTKLDIYCVPVGQFATEDFDFIKQLYRMQELLSAADAPKSLAEVYPVKENSDTVPPVMTQKKPNNIQLYDVVYACVSVAVEGNDK